jgi:hypothetical protein
MVTPSKGRTHGPGKMIVRPRNDGSNRIRSARRNKFRDMRCALHIREMNRKPQ